MNKNIIYKLIGVVVFLVIGEGVLGWAIYWPLLWYLLDWKYVYWLGLVLGFVLTGVTGLEIGWSSLCLVTGLLGMSFLRKMTGKEGWIEVFIVTGVAWIVNMVAGLRFGLIEAVAIVLLMMFLRMRDSWGNDIRV